MIAIVIFGVVIVIALIVIALSYVTLWNLAEEERNDNRKYYQPRCQVQELVNFERIIMEPMDLQYTQLVSEYNFRYIDEIKRNMCRWMGEELYRQQVVDFEIYTHYEQDLHDPTKTKRVCAKVKVLKRRI